MLPSPLFPVFLLSLTNFLPTWASICPRGYWAANVFSSSTAKGLNHISSERSFQLPYGPTGNFPICRFCPKISCFIMRLEIEVKVPKTKRGQASKASKEASGKKEPSGNSSEALTTSSASQSDGTSSGQSDSRKNVTIKMSCAPYSELPFPEQVITYLDCVQIGQEDKYYLYIYTPVNKKSVVEPVDCVDPNFLNWIPSRDRIIGLELGFPMKRLPRYFFRKYPLIMNVSGDGNNEPPSRKLRLSVLIPLHYVTMLIRRTCIVLEERF